MNQVEQARQAVREYLSRDHGADSNLPEEDIISTVYWLHEYRDNLAELIPLSEKHRGAWLACLNLLEHCEPTRQGHIGVIPDEQRLNPELRAELEKWAFRALTGQIKKKAHAGRPPEPLKDLRIQVAVYKAKLCGLALYAKGSAVKNKTACELVAEEVNLSAEDVTRIWKRHPA